MQEPGESSIFAEKFDTMEIAVFKTKGNKETIVKNELELVVKAIREGQYRDEVAELRQIYPLIRPSRDDDGRMQTAFSLQFRLELPRLCFLHYPPRYRGYTCPEILALLKQYRVAACYYGHLHSDSHKLAVEGDFDGTHFQLLSADYINFTPVKLLD